MACVRDKFQQKSKPNIKRKKNNDESRKESRRGNETSAKKYTKERTSENFNEYPVFPFNWQLIVDVRKT